MAKSVVRWLLDSIPKKRALFKINNKGNKALIQRISGTASNHLCRHQAFSGYTETFSVLSAFLLLLYSLAYCLNGWFQIFSQLYSYGMSKRMKNDFTNCACQWFSISCKILSFFRLFSLFCRVNWKSERRVMY